MADSEDTSNQVWWLLSCLPYCPSKEDIAREHRYINAVALFLCDDDDELEEVEEFYLDDSHFGAIPATIIRDRDPKALYNNDICLPDGLPFFSDEDGVFELKSTVRRNVDELRSAYNFTRVNIRQWVRKSVQKHRKSKDLRKMLDLPQDLIFEILYHVHPIDLHAFRRVNRAFRTFLSSPSSNVIWRRSFKTSSAPSTPLCPIDVNGWEWARLLFGSSKCDDCEAPSELVRPDVAMRQRLCGYCLSSRITQIHDDMPIEAVPQMSIVHDMILKTLDQNMPPFPHYTEPDYLVQADFDAVLQECVRLQENIDKGVEGADAEMEQYKTTRRAYVQTQLAHVRECNAWLIEVKELFESTMRQKYDYYVKSIHKHLRREGFKDFDINAGEHDLCALVSDEHDPYNIYFNEDVARYPQLTRSNWRKIRERYRAVIEGHAQRRLREERMELVRRTIDDFRKTLSPMKWRYWPPESLLHGTGPFRDLTELSPACTDNIGVEEACEKGRALLRPLIDDWLSGVLKRLRNEARKAGTAESTSTVDPLQLSTAVFQCSKHPVHDGHCLIGWESVALHLRFNDMHNDGVSSHISFFRKGSNVVRALLRLLNLDAATTLAKDLDARDDRFVCLSCEETRARVGYNRREAVVHKVTSRNHDNISWKVLPSRYAAILKRREIDPTYAEDVWSCNHCPAHLEENVIRRTAVSHVFNEHGVRRPEEDVDFFYVPQPGGRTSIEFRSVPDAALHLCFQCQPKVVMTTEDRMLMHQRDKHQDKMPIKGRAYVCVWEGIARNDETDSTNHEEQ
ncbi:hypothetical protein V5O48_001285 [Marasmius crinis-equi]|uniref:F-box domain-containing protein n=1 Tax=Marasmius crinis-equi TaxID=585013 RepID=A0ABR3FYT9_9AGAR